MIDMNTLLIFRNAQSAAKIPLCVLNNQWENFGT